MLPKEVLDLWSKACNLYGIPWYLYRESLLCVNGLQDFHEQLKCAQVVILEKYLSDIRAKVFPMLPEQWKCEKSKEKIKHPICFFEKEQMVLSIDILCDTKEHYCEIYDGKEPVRLEKKLFAQTEMLACQDSQFPVFSGYREYLSKVYGDYENGLTDDIGVGLNTEEKLALREHQVRCREALAFVQELSQEFGLRYYLIAGSVLGAVRHGGFIQWDDDVDIGIRIEDLEEFEAVVREYLPKRLPEGFTLEQPGVDDPYPRIFSKICYEGRCCIDLWPLVPAYTKGIRSIYAWYFGKFIAKAHYIKINRPNVKYRKFINLFIFFLKDKQVMWLARRNERRYINRRTPAYINLYSVYRREKELIMRQWLDTPAMRNFGGIEVPVVGCTEEYLTHLYGDYMTYPAPWKRTSRHFERFGTGRYSI